MVKRGGTKRKAVIKKITDKNSKAVTFSKRRDGLYSKAAQLCLLGDAQMAILATPSSSNSNVSFFSFGHSSVDSLVSAYLSGQKPVPFPKESREMREDIAVCMARKELGLGNWWDEEKIARSKDPREIMQAMESIKILWQAAERLLDDEDASGFDRREGGSFVVDEKKHHSDVVLHHHGIGKTLTDVDDGLLPETLITTEWSDMDLDLLLSDDSLDEKPEGEEEEEDEHHHHNEAVSQNYCSYNNALLSPAALNDDHIFIFGCKTFRNCRPVQTS